MPGFMTPILSYLCVGKYAVLNLDIDWSSVSIFYS